MREALQEERDGVASRRQAGGRLVVADPKTPEDLAALLGGGHPSRLDCDVLVNCTGLAGARDLFGDSSVYPIRGQAPPSPGIAPHDPAAPLLVVHRAQNEVHRVCNDRMPCVLVPQELLGAEVL